MMIKNAVVSAIEGDSYRVDVSGNQSAPLKCLAHAAHFEVDFERRTVTKKPLHIGDKVLVYFEGAGYGGGYILGLAEA